MSDASDDDLEREALALLREVREPPVTPPEVRARALARLMALPRVAPRAPSTSARSAIARALNARVPAWSLIASFVAGGAVAAVATRTARTARTAGSTDRAERAAPVATSAAPPATSTTSAATANATANATASVPVAVTASAAVRPRPRDANRGAGGGPAGARTADGALEEERSLLDVARTAVGRGDGASALRAAEVHAKRFPRGVLVEEREAMIIQALRLLHRDDEARAKLERFRGRYPTSLIRPALEAPEDAGAP